MTEWIRIVTLATRGTQIWTIITPISINHPKRKKDLCHTFKLNSNDNYWHQISESVLVCAMERIRTLSGNPRNVLWNSYAENLHILSSAEKTFWNNYRALQMEQYKFWLLHILKFPYVNNTFLYTLVCSTEYLRRRPRELANFWFRKQYGIPASYV